MLVNLVQDRLGCPTSIHTEFVAEVNETPTRIYFGGEAEGDRNVFLIASQNCMGRCPYYISGALQMQYHGGRRMETASSILCSPSPCAWSHARITTSRSERVFCGFRKVGDQHVYWRGRVLGGARLHLGIATPDGGENVSPDEPPVFRRVSAGLGDRSPKSDRWSCCCDVK